MVFVQPQDQGYLIEEKFFYGFETPNPKYINLASVMGQDMRYHKFDYTLIDYAGEYDIGGVMIRVYAGAGGRLNYIITMEHQKLGIIQSPEILEQDEITGVTDWLYTEDAVAQKIEQLELEGEKQRLA